MAIYEAITYRVTPLRVTGTSSYALSSYALWRAGRNSDKTVTRVTPRGNDWGITLKHNLQTKMVVLQSHRVSISSYPTRGGLRNLILCRASGIPLTYRVPIRNVLFPKGPWHHLNKLDYCDGISNLTKQ